METKKTLLEELNENNIFTSDTFTYYEYVDQLTKLQTFITKRVFKESYHSLYGIEDVATELKKKAIEFDVFEDEHYSRCLKAIKTVQKELAISSSGKKAEDRVNKMLSNYVNRKDFVNYPNLYISNDNGNTEIDNVILTRNGIILLEVKNIKSDATISRDGRLFIDNDCSYEKMPLAKKMEYKRNLFKSELKKFLKAKGICIDIMVDSLIVFNNSDLKKHFINNQSDEAHCTTNELAKIIDDYEEYIPYSLNQFEILNECLSKFSHKKKPFKTNVNFTIIKQNLSYFIDLIEEKELELHCIKTVETNESKTKEEMRMNTHMDKVISKLAGFGVPILIFITAIGATGLSGAAAYTTALVAIGPMGMIGGIGSLLVFGLISETITEFGITETYNLVIKEMCKQGQTQENMLKKVNKYPISKSMKYKLNETINNYFLSH